MSLVEDVLFLVPPGERVCCLDKRILVSIHFIVLVKDKSENQKISRAKYLYLLILLAQNIYFQFQIVPTLTVLKRLDKNG